VNHPDTDIADAIIAGIGGADNSTEQMAAVVTNLERAGFKIIPRTQYEALVAAAELTIEASNDCNCGTCDVPAGRNAAIKKKINGEVVMRRTGNEQHWELMAKRQIGGIP
jgi:hypothetical protein